MSQKSHFSYPNRTVAVSVSFSPIHTTKADEPVPNKWRCGVLTPFLEAKPSCKIDYGFRIIDYGFRITDYGFRITYYSALWCHPTTQIGWIFQPSAIGAYPTLPALCAPIFLFFSASSKATKSGI